MRGRFKAIHRCLPRPEGRPRTPLFKSQRGNRLSCHAAADVIAKCGARAELPQKIIPHVLRHSFATAMVGNGCDIWHLSNMLGNNDIGTTQIYLHVNNEKLREQYDKGVPRLA
ncbi:tyrosine-type recombinase/integrase [Methanomassiliicoccus luminyensis]|uniref:tyrosine-type recombinase/integrase n=1 Tax=Methanomassiliicoccus luminyensis TaxID=1080712 RepID=UPI001EE654DE|nr:tyrosine-type recombinase/integrase [Methanomassiliicoccus luminyensis]